MSADRGGEEERSREARARVERMVSRYIERGGYVLNPDPVTVEHVMAALARNLVTHGRWYCPCREVLGDPEKDRKNICPCPQHHADIARGGTCECGIFVSKEYARTSDSTPTHIRKGGMMGWKMELGAKAPDFTLKGVDGKTHSLSDYADKKAVAVIVSCNHCPTVIQYEDRMVEIQRDYADKGVLLVAINGNETDGHPTDSFDHMVQRAKAKGLNFPYLRDDTQDILKALGAVRTPEVFLFGPDRTLVYHGRIDDNADNPSRVKRHDLREALNEVLAGKPVSVPDTPPVGCTVKWWGKDAHWMPGEE